MITAPFNTPSYYTLLLEKPVASFVGSLVAPTFSSDIHQVMITSLDMKSDIEATVEMQKSTKKLLEALDLKDVDSRIEYNPIYLPMKSDSFLDDVEINSEGDIMSISGFVNPFITAQLAFSMPDYPMFIAGQSNYHQFQLPSSDEMLRSDNGVNPS